MHRRVKRFPDGVGLGRTNDRLERTPNAITCIAVRQSQSRQDLLLVVMFRCSGLNRMPNVQLVQTELCWTWECPKPDMLALALGTVLYGMAVSWWCVVDSTCCVTNLYFRWCLV